MELKNDIQLRGTLKSVDQYLNIKLDDISVVEELKYPHMVCNKTFQSCGIIQPRGPTVPPSRRRVPAPNSADLPFSTGAEFG